MDLVYLYPTYTRATPCLLSINGQCDRWRYGACPCADYCDPGGLPGQGGPGKEQADEFIDELARQSMALRSICPEAWA